MNYIHLYLLKNIKGRFLLSINDSPNIRNIFKDFKITSLEVRGAGSKYIGEKNRKELLIKNYYIIICFIRLNMKILYKVQSQKNIYQQLKINK